MNSKDGIPDIAAMKEATAQDFRRLTYENHALRMKNHELIVMEHKVIDFASIISLEESKEPFNRDRPFPQIWEELTKRVEDKFLEASLLKTLNQRFREELKNTSHQNGQ